jgi:selenocysteine lyase/cysteine desulfurase
VCLWNDARPQASFRPAAVEGLSDFELRFQYTGTRDYTPLAAISAAMDFRDIIGEEAIVQYNHSLAVWANKYLSELWGTQALVADEATAAMAHVMLPVRCAHPHTLMPTYTASRVHTGFTRRRTPSFLDMNTRIKPQALPIYLFRAHRRYQQMNDP